MRIGFDPGLFYIIESIWKNMFHSVMPCIAKVSFEASMFLFINDTYSQLLSKVLRILVNLYIDFTRKNLKSRHFCIKMGLIANN